MVGEEKRKAGRPKKQSASEPVIRKALRDNLDKIVGAFVKVAMEGSCPHFKLVCELLEKGDDSVKRDPARELVERWRREQRKKSVEEGKVRGSDGRYLPAQPQGGDRNDLGGAVTTDAQESLEAR